MGFAFKSFDTFGFCSSANVSLLNVHESFSTHLFPHLRDQIVVSMLFSQPFWETIRFMLDSSDRRQMTGPVCYNGRDEVVYSGKIKMLYVPKEERVVGLKVLAYLSPDYRFTKNDFDISQVKNGGITVRISVCNND